MLKCQTAHRFLLWCNHIKSDPGIHLLQMYKHGYHVFVFLSSALLRNLKNNNLFKSIVLLYKHTEKGLFYPTECGVFLPKVNRPFFHKISCGVSWVGGVVCLTVILPTGACRQAIVDQLQDCLAESALKEKKVISYSLFICFLLWEL